MRALKPRMSSNFLYVSVPDVSKYFHWLSQPQVWRAPNVAVVLSTLSEQREKKGGWGGGGVGRGNPLRGLPAYVATYVIAKE